MQAAVWLLTTEHLMPIKADSRIFPDKISPCLTANAEPDKSRFVLDKSHIGSYLPDKLPDL